MKTNEILEKKVQKGWITLDTNINCNSPKKNTNALLL